jgi:hypothetical protein
MGRWCPTLIKNCHYAVRMLTKVLKITLLSLLLGLLPPSLQSVNAGDILWNPGVSNDLYGAGSGLVPGARIKNTNLLVEKSNPDELIMKVVMSESFEDKPFTGKGRNMAMWIYWPTDYCWGKSPPSCEGLYIVPQPFSPSTYPSAKSSEFVFVEKHNKAANADVKPTSCKAPWWIESTNKIRDTWSFAVSITCLGIPKEFGWYAYSSINLGQNDVVSDFTRVQMITYPFHDLAAKAYKKPTDLSSINLLEKKSQYISDSLNKLKSATNKSKLKDKSLYLKQLNGILKSANNNTILLKSAKNSGNNDPVILDNINKVLNSMINQINALNKLLKLPPIKTDIIEYTVFLDKAVYQKGEIAKVLIRGRDLYGINVTDGTPLAFSNSDINFSFLSLNIFKNTPVFSDVSVGGLWQYELVIGSEIGTYKITSRIGNNAEQTINYAVK